MSMCKTDGRTKEQKHKEQMRNKREEEQKRKTNY